MSVRLHLQLRGSAGISVLYSRAPPSQPLCISGVGAPAPALRPQGTLGGRPSSSDEEPLLIALPSVPCSPRGSISASDSDEYSKHTPRPFPRPAL